MLANKKPKLKIGQSQLNPNLNLFLPARWPEKTAGVRRNAVGASFFLDLFWLIFCVKTKK